MERRPPSWLNVERIATTAIVSAFVACAAVDSSAPAELALSLRAERRDARPQLNQQAGILPENVRYTASCNGLFCTFDARASIDPAGIVKWAWDWGDGTTVVRTTPTAKKLFANPGISDVTLTVTNAADLSGSVTKPDTILAEPAGMTKLTETGFNCINGCGEWGAWDAQYAEAATMGVDPTAPKSPGAVVRMNYLPLLRGGWAPMSFAPGNNTLPQKKTIYVAIWMKLSSNFQGHPSGVNKVLHFWTKNGRNTIVFIFRGSGSGTLVPAFATQGMSGPYQGATEVNFNSRPEACTTVRDRWHRYEMVLTNNTPGGPDGTAQLWMDGAMCLNVSGLTYVGAGQNNKWEQIWWSPTWGGVNGSVFAPFAQVVDHIYVSGK
jgi:PKD repeat protein